MESTKITYSFKVKDEEVYFSKINEICETEYKLILKRKLLELEMKMKEAATHYFLKNELSPEQLGEIKIEFKNMSTEGQSINDGQ